MARKEMPTIKALVTLLGPEQGGRTTPVDQKDGVGQYRPHLVIEEFNEKRSEIKDSEYLGVAFCPPICIFPGETGTVQMELIYHPDVAYDLLVVGAAFTIREGAQIVGHGKVLKRD